MCTDSDMSRAVEDEAMLRTFPLILSGKRRLISKYHMKSNGTRGTDAMGELRVLIDRKSVLVRRGNQGPNWHTAVVLIPEDVPLPVVDFV